VLRPLPLCQDLGARGLAQDSVRDFRGLAVQAGLGRSLCAFKTAQSLQSDFFQKDVGFTEQRDLKQWFRISLLLICIYWLSSWGEGVSAPTPKFNLIDQSQADLKAFEKMGEARLSVRVCALSYHFAVPRALTRSLPRRFRQTGGRRRCKLLWRCGYCCRG